MNKDINKFSIQKSFAISAGAGSGKTYTLSRRYINAVLGFDFFTEESKQRNYLKNKKPAKISQIVTITYTEAAALEMKERIFDLMQKVIDFDNLDKNDKDYKSIEMGMNKLSKKDKEYVKSTLQTALNNSNEAFISTIHSFCLNLLSVNSDVVRIDSKLEILTDEERQKLLDEIIFEIFTSKENDVLDTFSAFDKFKAFQIIEKYTTDSQFRINFDKFIKKPIKLPLLKDLIKDLYPLPPIPKEVFDEIKDSVVREKWFNEYIDNFDKFQAKKWAKLKEEKAPSLGVTKFPELTKLKEEYDKLVSVYADIDTNKEKQFTKQLKQIDNLLKIIYEKYQAKLKENKKIDFDTIISLVEKNISKFKTDYKYIMVDEFQDTNHTQNSLISKLSKNKNLFVVGDAKQSIYSFQGAELEVFNQAIDEIDTYPMNVNYRSDKEILNFVNKVFASLFDDKTHNIISSDYKAKFSEDDELTPNSDEDGSVEFLISQDIDHHSSEGTQYKDIARFIKAIKENKISGYDKIKQKIANNQKAIGVLFDSSTHMLKLKKELNNLGIECKVSATEEFYSTKEVNDIFLTLKATSILKLNIDKLTSKQKYFIAGALRSDVFQKDENEIRELLDDIDKLKEIFAPIIENYDKLKISQLIKFIVDEYNLYQAYLYLGDVNQKIANIEKLINQTIMYESKIEVDIWKYLKEFEYNIYFAKELKEDEAFYKSENVESIELCTIHSTKGLAYPMVILAQSEKSLISNSSGEMGLSFNTFTANNTTYSAIGFKVGEYEPLIYRILKKISQNKHFAEKKRLLYVALTRAEHHLIIAGSYYENKTNPFNINKESYLNWIIKDVYDTDIEGFLQLQDVKFIKDLPEFAPQKLPSDYEIEEYNQKEIEFNTTHKIASNNTEHTINENIANQARLGTIIHSILQRYWHRLDEKNILDVIYKKYYIFDDDDKTKIKNYIDNFKKTITYNKLKDGVEHYFEIELNSYENDIHLQGIIDLLYKDGDKWIIVDFKSNNVKDDTDLVKFAKNNGYDKQLQTYQELCKNNDIEVDKKVLLFLESGNEVEV